MESPGTGNKSDLFLSADIDQPVAECLRIGDAALSALVSAEILRFSSPFQSSLGIKASRTKRIMKKEGEGKKKSLLEVIISSKNSYEKSSPRVSEQFSMLLRVIQSRKELNLQISYKKSKFLEERIDRREKRD